MPMRFDPADGHDDVSPDVVIVGGGVQGSFGALKLAERGIPCLVVDESQAGGYSSTRNQGWAQSGAYYATVRDPAAAIRCKAGHAYLLAEYGDCVLNSVGSYFLFRDAAERDRAMSRCAEQGIAAQAVGMERIVERNGFLAGSPLRYAMVTADRPIDTQAVLSRVAQAAASRGARFREVPCLHVVTISRGRRGWRVSLGNGQSVEAPVVLLACGPFIPEVFRTVEPAAAASLTVTKVPVLVLRSAAGILAKDLLITPGAVEGPSTVPFRDEAGTGMTVCLAGIDVNCDRRGAYDEDFPEDMLARHEARLKEYYPALYSLVSEREIFAHFYICQKLRQRGQASVTRGEIAIPVVEPTEAGNRLLLGLYPGKFTAAPVVAEEYAGRIEEFLGGHPRPQLPVASSALPITRQPYYRASDYVLVARNDELSFQPIPRC